MHAEVSDSELERRGRAGDIASLLALGIRFGAREDINRERACFGQAAKLGSAAGVRMLAKSLLSRQPIHAADGIAMMRHAAGQGDAEAIHLCAVLAAQDENLPERWAAATELSAQAAAQGYPLAVEEGAITARHPLTTIAAAAPMKAVREAPRIAVFEAFAAPDLCDWLVARARPYLQRALVYDDAGDRGREQDARDNSAAAFDVMQSDVVMMALRTRVKASVGLPQAGLERLSVLHYAAGQRFEPHFDFLDPAIPAQARDMMQSGGQRVATFLLYLNDDFEGGETAFLELDYRFKGRKGDAILFWNVDARGVPDRRTKHAGLPTTRGEKWLYSQWIREWRI
jgi:prolyl 4-hydroxylase